MAFKVSNKAFEEAFSPKNQELKTIKSSKIIVDSFIKELTAYLKTQEKYPAAKSMSRWLSKGGSISSFSCRGDLVEPMISELRSNGVPFILVQEMTGSKGFLIRSKDNEKQRKIVNHLLNSSADYCHITTGKKAGEIYRRRRIQNRDMIAVGNITPEQLIYLQEALNKIMPGETVGVDRMEDGTYLVTVHGQTAIVGSPHSRGGNFASALAETIFLFNANVKKDMVKASKETRDFRRAKANGFLDANGETKQPVWIVGRENIFVKRTVRGFEIGHAEEIGNQVVLESDKRVLFDDERYEVRLTSALAKITNKKVLYRLEDVIEHFKTKKKYLRDTQLAGEQHLMEEVDRVVANKVRGDSAYVKGNNWALKLKHYQSEVSKVLSATKEGKIPIGYRKEQIVELMDIAYRYKLDLELAAPAIEKIRDTEVFERPALPKVRSLEQHLARFSKDRDVQPPTIERSAVGRDADGR